MADFQGLVTLTLTLDRVILHTVMHHSSTSTYIQNFVEIEETFYGQTDGHLRPTLLGQHRRIRPNNVYMNESATMTILNPDVTVVLQKCNMQFLMAAMYSKCLLTLSLQPLCVTATQPPNC